ncbi:putative ATP-dependent RNA helicase spindle-E [Trachymyrmex septentrionalis]|uniref:Probable ATP-dependent RNA helicase spindle-E n=1 Tax=Trachymyrmex septentrionalis TaxID=34720 RepID=A0A195F736_9HYME|nr:putative ATP-dependent RNA helicase spindle-E [Trachymyrmex septentrionalis]
MNQRDENRKKCNLNMTEELEDSLQSLYEEDLAKVYRECSFTYNPKSNDLSILSMRDKIISIIETNSVIIIQGPTGCGKTTQIPQFILDANIKKRLNCNIIVTQPRRIAAISIAKRVSQEGNWRLGSLVGYQVGMQKEVSHETRLTYCTTEILLQHLIHNKHMLDYTHVILDEIHERDQNLDFLLLVVKRLLQTNSGQVKVILMSATINVIKFAKYFSSIVENELIPAPILKIPGKKNFEIRTYYLDEIKNLGSIPEVSVMEPKVTQKMLNFCSLIINALDEIDINDNEKDLNSSQRHAVLIFLPGIYEIEELYNYLSSTYHQNKLWDLTILHSLVSDDHEQHRVFQKPLEGYRRIILSTNIAESSITVPDVKYVIDFCLTKLLTFDPATHYQSLQLCWASKTNCIQRAGRTGRVMDGRVYRLVPKAFYDAIMMRQCNVPIKIKLLNIKEANEKAKDYNLHKFGQNVFFYKNFERLKNNVPQIRSNLPGLDVTFIPLFIQNIVSPGSFWATLDDDITRSKLRVIKEILNKRPLKKLLSIPKISTIIAAPIEENDSLVYHRAIIKEYISEIGELVDVFFIDYGHFSRIRFSDLRKIDSTTILAIPPLAFRCNLAFLRPSNQRNPHGQWSERSRNYFLTQIKKTKKILGKIYSIVDSVINLELIVINEKEESFNVNETLIKKGYAIKREESHVSQQNHELRANISNINAMSIEEKQFYEEKQYDKHELMEYPKPPKEEDCTSSVNLQGPFSPLEMELIQLTLGGRLKKINVDMKSVNSVLLDDDLNQSRRLLIAQSTTQSNKNSLTLRNTTFLPNIPGLAALLTLSFAPRMELRCNSRRTYYTGALCGLGPKDNFTNRSIFPDHDIEIQFDVEITIDDVKEINKLRHWMNTAMQLDNISDEDIILYQNKIKHILLELKEKQRQSRNPEDDEIDQLSDKWNRYNGPHFLPYVRENVRKGDVYPLHKALELRETNEQMEEMLKHLSQLQSLAYEDASVVGNVAAFCKLCETETFGLLQLRNHLYSEQHAENEKLLHRQLH